MLPIQGQRFQSLNRAYKRSDDRIIGCTSDRNCCFNPSIGLTSVPTLPESLSEPGTCPVSIPQSGLQAFRQCLKHYTGSRLVVSIPQSGLQAFRLVWLAPLQFRYKCFNPSIGLTSVPTLKPVSLSRRIQVSFNPSIGLTSVPTQRWTPVPLAPHWCFNPSIGLTSVPTRHVFFLSDLDDRVSIPQSGLQAFRRVAVNWHIEDRGLFQSLNRAYKRSDLARSEYPLLNSSSFNPSIGLTSVPTWRPIARPRGIYRFQSLNRAYKRSDDDVFVFVCFRREVSIPQSGLQAFRPAAGLAV